MFTSYLSSLSQENYNEALSKRVRYVVDKNRLDDPHVKANLLFQVELRYLFEVFVWTNYA